jgi:hypothetical protein
MNWEQAGVSFFDEMMKISNESPLRMANEIAGLGVLAAPSVQELRGKKVDEHTKHIAELTGLGMLAAPYAYDLGALGVNKLQGVLRPLRSTV